MNNDDDRNYISTKQWMGILFVLAIPIIGQIMFLVWTFYGDNESRKNYFRAIFVWILIFLALVVVLMLVSGKTYFTMPFRFDIPLKHGTK